MWFFRVCSHSRNDTTPRHTWLIFCTLHTTLDSTVQWSCTKLDPWFYYNLPGETLVQNSKTHRPSSSFNKPATNVNCTRKYTRRNSNRHISETSSTSSRAIQRGKGIERQWPERRKMSERKEKPKVKKLQVTRVPRQKAIGCCARERLHVKLTSWGGGKRSQFFETTHFSFLPSLAGSWVGVFLFFEISKLENLAIKLVEIGSEKHKFPNLFFLLKRGNLVFKRHWCLLHR